MHNHTNSWEKDKNFCIEGAMQFIAEQMVKDMKVLKVPAHVTNQPQVRHWVWQNTPAEV